MKLWWCLSLNKCGSPEFQKTWTLIILIPDTREKNWKLGCERAAIYLTASDLFSVAFFSSQNYYLTRLIGSPDS